MFLKIILVLLVPAGIWAAKAYTMPCASLTSPDEDPYNHREEIKDSRLSCKYYRCNNGTWVEGYRACVFNNRCYPANRKWTSGCNKLKCVVENKSMLEKIYRTIITSPECSFEGQCKKKGATWESNCIKYRCEFNITNNPEGPIYQENLISEASCKWGRKCIKADEIVEKDCLKYKCHIEYSTDDWGVKHINRHVRLESKACFGINNKKSCIPIGQTEKFVCSTYECKQSRNFMEMVLTSYGCKDKNGDCVYESGIVNTTACTQHTCTRTGWQLNSYACSYNNECILEGNSVYDRTDCVRRVCTLTRKKSGKNRRVVMEMKIAYTGCPFNGTCKGDNEKWTDENCVERICKITKRSNGSYYRKNDIVKPNCKDADGYCVPLGQKLSANVDGTRYDDCKCSRKGRNGNQVTCSKTVIKGDSITHS
ncbi:Hypothetical predicted protein [Mytilus galloprovincialis]|nr:Hypothetical predicted protein [Mytilus galloprovincialis]